MAYRIGTVSELTGIPVNTITAWERRYELLNPGRASSGYRIYNDGDVALLRRIRALQEQGYRISEAVSIVRQDRPTTEEPAAAAVDGAFYELRSQLKRHLLAYDRAPADEIRQRLMTVSFRIQIDDVYLPLLREVGAGWAAGEVSVAQEHFVSAWVRSQLVGMLLSLGQSDGGPLAICAGFPGDLHELGLLAVAIKLGLHGFRVMYLGADLPASELIRVAVEHPADVVCTAVTRQTPPEQIAAYAAQIRRAIPYGTKVIVGGPGVAGLVPPPGVAFCARLEELLDLVALEVRSAR